MLYTSKFKVVSLLSLSVAISGCFDSKAQQEEYVQTVSVQTYTLQQSEQYQVEREYVGTVQAGQKARLGFEFAGKVSSILVDVGDKVDSGTPLITLDTQLLETEARQLRAQRNEIRAQLNLVDANLKRQQSLKSKGFSAEAEIDALNSQKGVLQANTVRLNAVIQANSLKQTKSTIKAPYSGTVSRRHVSLGDVVNAGSPTLTLLSENDKEAFIGIPTIQLRKVSQISDPKIRIGKNQYDAKLINPGGTVDLNSRSIGLRYLLPDTARVLDGQLAYLTYTENIPEAGFWIPNTALTDGIRGVWNVFVLTQDNVIERRSIQVLFADNEQAYVAGAISEGERIVENGLHRVVPGQVVSPKQG
ncbi:efflux RND transporter periplasmic adaptor subunit [Vibrio breoganii]